MSFSLLFFISREDEEEAMRNYPTVGDLTLVTMKKVATQGAAGLPLNVQVIGRPWQEEVILRVMREIETAVQFRSKYYNQLAIHS